MRILLFTSTLILASLFSCRQDRQLQDQLIATQADLIKAKAELDKATSPPAITHLVYLDTKEDIDMDALKKELARLGEIPGVIDYQTGSFINLNDPRAMSQHELVLAMGFAGREDYQAYQQHPTHLDVKAKLGPFLAGPPVTYDFE